MTPGSKLGAFALIVAVALIGLLPSASQAEKVDLSTLDAALRNTTQQLNATLQQSLDHTEELLRRTEQALRAKPGAAQSAQQRATATDPPTQPPLHGANPHGQGSVAVIDVNPSSERPLSGDPDGGESGEEVVVGRTRGEQVNGVYHGHITILALLGSELAGVDTAPGETKNGPLQPLQSGVLDPLCGNSGGQVCLSVLTANSTTTSTGSTNDFAIARASVLGLGANAANSQGVITQDANCQTANGAGEAANITGGGAPVAQLAKATSMSKSCRNQPAQTANTSMVLGLGGVQLPLPAAGCANGTPDTVTGIPAVLPIVCNADDVAGAAAVREALDVFVLQVGGTSLAKQTTAAAESISVAPAGPENGGPECSDGVDNDGDGVIDADDPGCHTDGNPNNPDSFNPNDDDESDGPGGGTEDDGDDGGPNGGGSGAPECSDNTDNDGDGVIDANDPGCHTDGDPNNPDSYNPNDDSEDDGARTADAGALPFTGTDITGLALGGLLMLAGGLLMRRREGARGL